MKGQWNCTTSSSYLYPILGRSHEIALCTTLLVTLCTRYNHLNYIARFNNFLQVQEIELVSYDASNKEQFLIFQSQVGGQVLKKLDTQTKP